MKLNFGKAYLNFLLKLGNKVYKLLTKIYIL